MSHDPAADMPAGFTIYVVDDEESIRGAFELYFAMRGLTVESFASGAEFLARCAREWRGCVFLDIRMPSMSGQEVLRRMRGRDIDLPVVFITGHEDVASLRSEFGAQTQVLKKPFSGKELDETLGTLLRTSG